MDVLTLTLLLALSFALAIVGARGVLTLVLHLMSPEQEPVAISGPQSPAV